MTGRAATSLRAAFAAGALLGLAGCAVMQIDVDVYKGPLANHEDVQVQQFAAMAIGAKPLLEQLKKNLVSTEKTAEKKDAGRANELKGHIERVDAILRLYYNKEIPPPFDEFVRQVERSEKKYRAAMSTLEPSPEFGAERWDRISKGFRSGQGFLGLPGVFAEVPTRTGQNIAKSFEKFRDGYRDILDPASGSGEFRRATTLGTRYNCLLEPIETFRSRYGLGPQGVEFLAQLQAGRIREIPETPECDKINEKSNRGSNAHWKRLTKKSVVQIHAGILFADPEGTQARQFIDAVVSTAAAFFAAREAIREVWLASIELLRQVDKLEALQMDDGTVSKFEAAERVRLTRKIGRLIAFLTQPRYLAVALNHPDFPSEKASALRDLLEGSSGSGVSNSEGRWDAWRYETATRALQEAIVKKPISVVTALLELDKRFFSADEQIGRTKFGNLWSSERRMFGIVQGPYGQQIISADELARLAGDTTAGLLERGRLDEGIFTLQENYLNMVADPVRNMNTDRCEGPGVCKKQIKAVRDLLLDALVRFAEKLLVIANNNALIDPSQPKTELNRYVLVLQAVGNSILIQGNELRFREEHKRKQKNAMGREVLGVGIAYSSDPRVVLDNLALAVGGKSDALAMTDEAYQAKITELDQGKQALEGKLPALKSKLASVKTALDTAHNNHVGALVLHTRRELASLFINRSSAVGATAPTILGVPLGLLGTFRAGIDRIVSKPDPTSLPASAWTDLQHEFNILFAETINGQSVVTEQANIRLLAKAHDGFAEIKATQVTDPIRSKAFDQLRTALEDQLELASTDLSAKAKLLVTAKADFTNAKNPVDELNTQIAAVKMTLKRTKANRALATELRHTLAAIKEYREEAIQEVRQKLLPITARNTTNELLVLFERDKAQPSKTTQLTDAIKHLESFPVPMVAPLSPTTKPKTAENILDDVIAALRHEHIKVVSQVGPDAKRSKDIAAALKVAYEQRAGMAYIRPSAAYLRSSYPSTSLQDDPGLAWRNMLGSHALRSVPFLGQGFANPPSEAEKRKIVNEIDKQFWQTINRVRVAGAGDTNYAIAKDDIGNWYVKAFSADPKVIIKSAQKLALFNIGAQLDTDLLSRLDAEDGEAPNDVSKPALQRLFDEFEKDYAEKTKEDFDGLKASIEGAGLETRIAAAWFGIKDVEPYFKRSEIESDLTSTFGALEQTEFTETTAADQSKKILATADAILRFHGALARTIRERQLTIDPTVKLKQNEKTLSDRNAVLKAEEEELSQKKAERDAANDIVQEKLRADQLDREGFDEAQTNLEEKEAAVQKQEGEVNIAREAVRLAVAAVAKAQEDLQKVEHAERAALAALSREVREDLSKLAVSRDEAVKTFETGVLFIGKATKPAAKAEAEPSPAPAGGVPVDSRGG